MTTYGSSWLPPPNLRNKQQKTDPPQLLTAGAGPLRDPYVSFLSGNRIDKDGRHHDGSSNQTTYKGADWSGHNECSNPSYR